MKTEENKTQVFYHKVIEQIRPIQFYFLISSNDSQ